MTMRFRPVRGMRDLLPDEARGLIRLFDLSRRLASLYGYEEVILPTIESYELFAAKSGGEIKERMYTFTDLGGRKVVLRPEATASVARIVASKMLGYPKPLRLFYIVNLFRYDEPQKGRYREFWQAGYELIGSGRALADAELIEMLSRFMEMAGLRDHRFKVGHVGVHRALMGIFKVPEHEQDDVLGFIDRDQWDEAMKILSSYPAELRDVLTGLASVKGGMDKVFEEAWEQLSRYEPALRELERLREILRYAVMLGVPRERLFIDMGFARGLAYYTGVIFECYSHLRVALAGGGRYDKLISLFGGPDMPATGFAIGLDRVHLAQVEAGVSYEDRTFKALVVLAGEDERVVRLAGEALRALRGKMGARAVLDVSARSIKRAFSYASAQGYDYVVVVGRREAEKGVVSVKNMKTGVQVEVPVEELPERLPD